jgi:hypothetical protein
MRTEINSQGPVGELTQIRQESRYKDKTKKQQKSDSNPKEIATDF